MRDASTLRSLSGALVALGVAGHAVAMPATCKADSPGRPATVLELYTSEGCSSCPPADRWLSERTADPSLIALAFHVDYWDRLGWKDRFGDPAYTERQARTQKASGARFSYTPQVIIDGRDTPDWWTVTKHVGATAAAPVELKLTSLGDRIVATVQPTGTAPARLAGFWATTEDGYRSEVRAGENSGVTLHHDRVVRFYRPLEAWSTGGATRTLELDPAVLPSTPGHARHLALVVTDAATGRPVQAVQAGC